MAVGGTAAKKRFSVLRETAAFCASLVRRKSESAAEAPRCLFCDVVGQVACFAPEGAGPGELEAVCLSCGQRWVARRKGRRLVLVAPITPYDE